MPNKLLQDFTSKLNKEENASGISPATITEAEQFLEVINEVIASNVLAPKAPKGIRDRAKEGGNATPKGTTGTGKQEGGKRTIKASTDTRADVDAVY